MRTEEQDRRIRETSGNLLKDVVPVVLHKVLLYEGYFQTGASHLGMFPVLLSRTNCSLVDFIPVLHKHTDDVETCVIRLAIIDFI